MSKRIAALFAALAVALSVALTPAGPAHAASSDCGNYPGTVCLFAHANWGLPIWRQYPDQINGCRALYGFNDVATMVWNRAGGHVLEMWEHADCTGNHWSIASGTWADMSGNWWNDEISAVRIYAA
jgi:hypothetical protein